MQVFKPNPFPYRGLFVSRKGQGLVEELLLRDDFCVSLVANRLDDRVLNLRSQHAGCEGGRGERREARGKKREAEARNRDRGNRRRQTYKGVDTDIQKHA